MLIIAPIKTEKAIKQIEFNNTLTFTVHENATKQDIKKEVETIFAVKVADVRIQNLEKGGKRAFVKLAKGSKTDEITAKLKFV